MCAHVQRAKTNALNRETAEEREKEGERGATPSSIKSRCAEQPHAYNDMW